MVGKLADQGVYTAPVIILSPRTVVLTARSTTSSTRFANVTITLADTPFKRRILGAFFFCSVRFLFG